MRYFPIIPFLFCTLAFCFVEGTIGIFRIPEIYLENPEIREEIEGLKDLVRKGKKASASFLHLTQPGGSVASWKIVIGGL